MNKTISFKFSGFCGDVIHYMAGIKQVCEDQNRKAVIFIWLDRVGLLYDGAQHPYEGKMINRYAFDMMRPLLLYQPYVDDVLIWQGEEIMIDMDKIREAQLGMPYGNLAHWIGMRFSDMQANLSARWLDSIFDSNKFDRTEISNSIIVNRTSRYQNELVSYYFLKDYDNVVFAGLEGEYWNFRHQWNLQNLKLLKVQDFLTLAGLIDRCKFFIGNQSMCFAIAEALKVPRILEICPFAPNVHPVGEHAHYFRNQETLVYWTDRLNNKLHGFTIKNEK